MISHFDLNFLLNSSDAIQRWGTGQFCSSQADHSTGWRFSLAQNTNCRRAAVLKSRGLQDSVSPARQAHSGGTAENSAATTMLFACFVSSFMEPHYLNCAERPFSSRKPSTVPPLRRPIHESPVSWALWFVCHSSPKVLVSSTAVNSFSYNIENDG